MYQVPYMTVSNSIMGGSKLHVPGWQKTTRTWEVVNYPYLGGSKLHVPGW